MSMLTVWDHMSNNIILILKLGWSTFKKFLSVASVEGQVDKISPGFGKLTINCVGEVANQETLLLVQSSPCIKGSIVIVIMISWIPFISDKITIQVFTKP